MILTAVLCAFIIFNFQCFIPIHSSEELHEAFYVKCKNRKLPNAGLVKGYLKSPSQCINKCNLQYFCTGVNGRKIQECMYSYQIHTHDSRLVPDCSDGSIMSETGIDSYIKRKTFYSSFSVIDRLYSFHMKLCTNQSLRILSEINMFAHSGLYLFIQSESFEYFFHLPRTRLLCTTW